VHEGHGETEVDSEVLVAVKVLGITVYREEVPHRPLSHRRRHPRRMDADARISW
jgi:hypothetical protein